MRGKVSNPHDAEELASSVFLKIVQKLDSYNPEKSSVSTWVYTITRSTVTDHFRTHHTMTFWEDYMEGEKPAAESNADALDVRADALLTRKEKERDLIVLHYYQRHTLKTAAEIMGMSYINAKVIHKKALTGLQTFFQNEKLQFGSST